jgi:hypothetical protein
LLRLLSSYLSLCSARVVLHAHPQRLSRASTIF